MKRGFTISGLIGLLVAGSAVLVNPSVAQVTADQQAAEQGWRVRSNRAADLWFHGLAVVGLGMDDLFQLYHPDYVEQVRRAKRELGIYPTPLDSLADELLLKMEEEPELGALHFAPLHFPGASLDEMFRALIAVAKRELRQEEVYSPTTRAGIRWASGMFREGDSREVLEEFLELLEQEWELFFEDYWERVIAADPARHAEIQAAWSETVEPALQPFLEPRRLDAGTILVSPALGPEGRLEQGSAFRRLDNVVAVWAPPGGDPDPTVFGVVRELCFAVVPQAVRASGAEAMPPELASRSAVRCGALLFDALEPTLVAPYQESQIAAAVALQGLAPDVTFEEAFPLDNSVVRALEEQIGPRQVAAQPTQPPTARAVPIQPGVQPGAPPPTAPGARAGPGRWIVRERPQVDLWFHALAVIAADQPGPLGLYSAEYAEVVREAKLERGVYPTALDSLAIQLREGIGDGTGYDLLHFVPLYFPDSDPEEMFMALRLVVDGDVPRPGRGGMGPPGGQQPSGGGPQVGRQDQLGMMILDQNLRGGARSLLEDLLDAVEEEWEIFYRDYWRDLSSEQQPRYQAVQAMWDSVFAPQLGRYLERRRLTAGLIFPSPPVGPEGRIVEFDAFNATDQIVAVQMPLSTDRPEPTVFAFLKELCFLLIDDQQLARYAVDDADLEDLRRRAAVRCGALILDFYAPTLAGQYRRVFLDAVGAEDSRTGEAFDRVYYLNPEVYELMREGIRAR
jgi:hypothetical protein